MKKGINITIMKRLLFLFSILFSLSAFSQVPLDSAFWDAETEDSVSALAIKPIEKPKKLLDSIITQLIRDWEHQPTIAHWYRVENRTFPFPKRPTYPVVSSCIFPAGAGVELKPSGNFESFSFEGPVKLSSRDSSGILFTLGVFSTHLPILNHVHHLSFDNQSKKEVFKKLMRLYDVKVYSITDNSGRGVYRVSYTPNKKITESNWTYYSLMVTGSAYFDQKTLHLIHANGEQKNCRYYPKLKVSSGGFYQVDYEMEGDIPVLQRAWNGTKEEKPAGAGLMVQKLE